MSVAENVTSWGQNWVKKTRNRLSCDAQAIVGGTEVRRRIAVANTFKAYVMEILRVREVFPGGVVGLRTVKEVIMNWC